MNRSGHKKGKKYSISLSEREGRLLQLYADSHSMTKPQALRRIVKGQLHQFHVDESMQVAQNQLELFDTIQIDIFNNHTRNKH